MAAVPVSPGAVSPGREVSGDRDRPVSRDPGGRGWDGAPAVPPLPPRGCEWGHGGSVLS